MFCTIWVFVQYICMYTVNVYMFCAIWEFTQSADFATYVIMYIYINYNRQSAVAHMYMYMYMYIVDVHLQYKSPYMYSAVQ